MSTVAEIQMVYCRSLMVMALIGICLSCRSDQTSNADDLSYRLLTEGTNTPTNQIVFEKYSPDMMFAVHGQGFSLDGFELGSYYHVEQSINLATTEPGQYEISLSFLQGDKTPLFDDVLLWEYSLDRPAKPIVGFSEKATSDDTVIFQVSTARGRDVDYLWIAGDVIFEPQGAWYEISADDTVQIQTTPEDGLKSFIVRLRNEFGNESDEDLTLEIEKKSIPPTDCVAVAIGSKINDARLKMRISAKNDGPLFYRVRGDIVGSTSSAEFSHSVDTEIPLMPGDGMRTLRIQIHDLANNYCETIVEEVEIDSDYEPAGIRFADNALWTDLMTVEAEIWHDHFPGQNVEMFIDGGVEETESTYSWIPLQSKVDLTLNGTSGNRYANVKFRVDGEETVDASTGIYLQPFVGLVGTSAPYKVVLSNFVDLYTVTIEGCAEAYVQVEFSNNYPCTPEGTKVKATYVLSDTSTVEREGEVP